MSTILAIADVTLHDWIFKINFDKIDVYSSTFEIGFTTNRNLPVQFNKLSFGYEFIDIDTNEKLLSDTYPKEYTNYVTTDQEYIVGITLLHLPEKNYKIKVFVKNNNINWENEIEFTVPRPLSPYPSWIWDIEHHIWKSPTPYPLDTEHYYNWDEESLSWVIIST